MQVSFVIGGTQKGGTSALDAFVRQHPHICMPQHKKETHFFDTDHLFRKQPDYEDYHAYFQPQPQHKLLGDATPIYMYWEPAPYRVWSYNPEMKWILVLRNPVERAFSAWNMEVQRQAEHLSFKEAIEQESTRCGKALPLQHRVFSYLDRGYYAHQVRRIFNIFGRENCLVLLNEDLDNNHEGTLRHVFDFLGVDNRFIPPAARVFEHRYSQALEPELRAKLTTLFYCNIKELECLLDRDLSCWYS